MATANEKYGHLTVPELKALLRQRSASLKGKKKDLIDRLKFYDDNNNFSIQPSVWNADDMLPSELILTPNVNCYKDINADTDLPSLTMSNINNYLNRFAVSIHSGKNMYENHFLLNVRMAVHKQNYFFKSQCKASMKKDVTYISDIHISSTGIVEACQCDCAVGEPPNAHCKHVICTLLAVEQLKRQGKIILDMSCTQKLQDFHKPRKQYFGSPVKSQHLSGNQYHPNCFKPIVHNIDPVKYKEKVNNLCINYVSHSNGTMPFKNTIRPANTYAVVLDHDYALNTEEELLKTLKLSNVTDEDIKYIEELTREQDKSQQWFDERRIRITASNFYYCCTAVSHAAKINLVQRLLNPTSFKSKQTQHGKDCEPKAIEAYKYFANVKTCGLVIMKKNPWLAASPDGLVGDDTVLEVKCPYNMKNSRISIETMPFLYEDNCGTLHLDSTHQYYFQIQGQLMVTEKQYAHLLKYYICGLENN